MFKKVFLPLNALQFCNLTLAVKLKIDKKISLQDHKVIVL